MALAPSSLVYQSAEKIGSDYAGRFLSIINELDQPDRRFIVLPSATRAGTDKPPNNDLFAIDTIHRRVETELSAELFAWIVWMNSDVNMQSIHRLLAHADVLLISRFHAMIAGLSLAVPTAVLDWSHKYEETLAAFGMERYVVPFNDTGASLCLTHMLQCKAH